MRIAYLCNQYPAPSHSFIRREIHALEAAGDEVVRLSIRSAPGLRDPDDIREAQATMVILGQPVAQLILALLRTLAARPLRTFRAFARAGDMIGPGQRGTLLRRMAYLVEACWLLGALRRRGVEHVHAHFGTNPAALARLVTMLGGPRYSFTVHGPDEFDAPIQLDLKGKVADASLVVAISNYTRAQLMRWSGPADWNKIVVVRCGVDETFLRGDGDLSAGREGALCCVARLSGQKGLPLLVEAAALLRDRKVEYHLTIIGDGELRESLERRIEALGVTSHVLLAGTKSGEEVRAALVDSRLLVLASFAEGLPVVIMEALALARPVVVTAIAGIPELVDGSNGWVVPAGSAAALADALEAALAASSAEMLEKGRIGRDRVLSMHDARANGRELSEHLAALGREQRTRTGARRGQ